MLEKSRSAAGMFPALRGLDDLFGAVLHQLDPLFASENLPDNHDYSKLELEVRENDVMARLPLPGFRAKEITVELENGILTVSAEHCETPKKKGKLIRRERVCESVEQSVRIPVAVLPESSVAEYADGVLSVTLPREKPAAAAGPHVVKING